MTWQMQLQVTVERPADDADTGRLLRSWFVGAFEAMGGSLRESLLAAAPLSNGVWRKREPYGQPGEVWSFLRTGVRGADGVRATRKVFTSKAWNVFLDGLAAVPESADIGMVTLDEQGYPNALPSLRISSQVNEDSDRWLFLNVRFGPDWLADPAYQKVVLTFLRGVAEEWNLAYGEISYDRGSGRTAYESVFRGQPYQTALESRRILRGYAWLTICPQEIGDRLGGVDALRGSGAFVEVDSLANGGYWLLATEDYRDFDQATAERIFPVLASALRPGEPLPDAPSDPPYYVSRRNAAEWQG